MSYIFLITFIIFSAVHLYASKISNKPLRNATKGFILFPLLAFYIMEAENPSWFVVIAILTSWLGDIFLIPHGVKWFTIGGIFFWISHFFFIISYSTFIDFTLVPIWAIILIAVIYATAVVFIFRGLKKHLPKALFISMFCYLLCNGGMNAFAFYRLISLPTIPSIITAVGAILFFISDSTLFFVRFNKNCIFKTHFLVMLTYTIGEFLIILGFML